MIQSSEGSFAISFSGVLSRGARRWCRFTCVFVFVNAPDLPSVQSPRALKWDWDTGLGVVFFLSIVVPHMIGGVDRSKDHLKQPVVWPIGRGV